MNEKTPYFEVGKWYAITLNYDDNLQYFGKPERETKVVNLTNERLLTYTHKKIDYILHLELSEPHIGKPNQSGPRLHYHGRIRFRSNKGLKLWLLNDYYNLLKNCIVDIDTIDCVNTWDKYCTKQRLVMMREPLSNIIKPDPSIDEIYIK
ncbi:MAG: hypothetical protein [Cressdnaviricota sp.]|nr:MAG: hypothetical protein [Cressdnaviricota sp.]